MARSVGARAFLCTSFGRTTTAVPASCKSAGCWADAASELWAAGVGLSPAFWVSDMLIAANHLDEGLQEGDRKSDSLRCGCWLPKTTWSPIISLPTLFVACDRGTENHSPHHFEKGMVEVPPTSDQCVQVGNFRGAEPLCCIAPTSGAVEGRQRPHQTNQSHQRSPV